jgi:lysophospholipase L1-like esterase
MRLAVRAVVVSLVLLATGVVAPVASAATSPALPSSMAALGDSITRAYNVCCFYGDHPGQSWSVGYTWYDGIVSHYERIKRVKPAVKAYNDGVTGANMSSAQDQAEVAARQGVRYVTILLGANDLCTSSASTMTSTAAFESQFRSAMSILAGQKPPPRILVSSIPDIYQLWKVLHTNPIAQQVWSRAGICPSMLAASNDEEDRQLVVDRELKFNNILAEVCREYENCRWDGGATYNYNFSASQVSTLDFFHPSLSGQAALARVSWAASWWPTI